MERSGGEGGSGKYTDQGNRLTPQELYLLSFMLNIEDIQRAQRYIKRCSASLAIREMQIKTTVRYHFTLVRMAIINKSTNNKC